MGVSKTAHGEDVKEFHDCNKAMSRAFDKLELKSWHLEICNSEGLSYITEALVFRGFISPFLIPAYQSIPATSPSNIPS
jgi:hypothetical protein